MSLIQGETYNYMFLNDILVVIHRPLSAFPWLAERGK
jgi:hypothetical protein